MNIMRSSGSSDQQSSLYQQYGNPIQDLPEVNDIIMYEVNIRAFSPSGDLAGVTDRLDEIKKLAVNVIWLLPIHPVGKLKAKNSPYAVRDHKAIGQEYGSLKDLRKLTDAAHERGMAVLMDWVANHTSWDHEWIDNKDWYTQDASGNITHPPGTNWLDVADLNFENQDMRTAMIDAMRYWILEANIDGYRYDHADGIPFDFWKEAIQALNTIPNRRLIHFADGYRKDHFDAGFDLLSSKSFFESLKETYNGGSLTELVSTHLKESGQLPPGKQWVRFTTNHDECAWERSPVKTFQNKAGALAAAVHCIFSGGVPLIYGSQEVGIEDNIPFFENAPINWSNDPEMLAGYRKIMHFYANSEVARRGKTTLLSGESIQTILKGTNNEVAVIINTRNTRCENFRVPEFIRNEKWLDVFSGKPVKFGETQDLEPFQFFLLQRI